MLHRYRSAMVLSGMDKLSGIVEVDEVFLGGVRAGPRGRGALGKVLVMIAVARHDPKGFGRTRMRVIPDARAETIKQFLLDCVESGSTIVTDGHQSYPGATQGIYTHEAHAVKPSGKRAHTMVPAVHRVASLLKRWFLGNYQGSHHRDHLDAYLAEFTFQWNRRKSPDRGLLFYRLMSLAVIAPPLRYDDIVKNPRAKPIPATRYPLPATRYPLPATKRVRPKSLSIPEPQRPWRTSTQAP